MNGDVKTMSAGAVAGSRAFSKVERYRDSIVRP